MADLPTSVTGGPTGIDPSGLTGDPNYQALVSSRDSADAAYTSKMTEVNSSNPGKAPTIQDAMSGRQELDAADPFTGLPPVDHLNDLMAQSPWLIGLAALGGSTFGVPAQAMLSATNGMVSGLIKGDQQAYQSEKDKYDAEYERYQKKHNEIFTIYKELQSAYKTQYGEYQGQLKAAQALKGIVGERQASVDSYLKALNMSHTWVTNKTKADAAKENADKKGAGGGKGGKGSDAQISTAMKEYGKANDTLVRAEPALKALQTMKEDLDAIGTKYDNWVKTTGLKDTKQFFVENSNDPALQKYSADATWIKAALATAEMGSSMRSNMFIQKLIADQVPDFLSRSRASVEEFIAKDTELMSNQVTNSRNKAAMWRKHLDDMQAGIETPMLSDPKPKGDAPKQTAPQAAIDYLKAHPEAKEAFKAKYGYLPDGN